MTKWILEWDRAINQVWVFKRRWHHGATGCLAVLFGVLLAWHDRRDFRDWFTLKRHEAT